MLSHELGFMSSWKMLTRDKGWIKPILVLTLVSWIPIIGPIAVLGYALEWARLTAWGVDAAPKQRGIDYGKLLSTGFRAFLITLSISVVVGLVLGILFPGSLAAIALALVNGSTADLSGFIFGGWSVSMVLVIILEMLVGVFCDAAILRATLYDSFGAGWRFDRLVQMISRDFGGFMHALAVTIIGSLVASVYAMVVGFLAFVAVMGGVLGVTAMYGLGGYYYDELEFVSSLLTLGAGPVLLFIVLGLVLGFIGSAIGVAMRLVGINAMGQWFCRFEVNRWGVSQAPLPDDVPHRNAGSWGASMAATPQDPMGGNAVESRKGAQEQDAVRGADAVTGVTGGVARADAEMDGRSAAAGAPPVPGVSGASLENDGVVPAAEHHGGQDGQSARPVSGGIPLPPVPGSVIADDSVGGGEVCPDDRACGSGAEGDVERVASADVEQAISADDEATHDEVETGAAEEAREPIPLGPISTDEQEPEHGGPILP